MTLLSIRRPSVSGSATNRNEYGHFVKGFANAVDKYVRDCQDLPSVNIIEEPKNYHIQLSAPGFSKHDFSVSIDKDILTISAEAKEDHQKELNYIVNEFSKCSFQRSFSLGKSIDTSKIEAVYRDGILYIKLTKREEAIEKPARSISVG